MASCQRASGFRRDLLAACMAIGVASSSTGAAAGCDTSTPAGQVDAQLVDGPTPADASAPGDDSGIADDAGVLADAAPPPEPPPGLDRWLVGEPGDALVPTTGPGIILMGGGPDVDAAFAWAASLAPGGDLVVLRASGSDGYNDYLFAEIGGFDSVETLLLDQRAYADSAYVAWAISHAEVVFIAGGDQAVYIDTWGGTGVEVALAAAWGRGAVLGGTSAGCAILGAFVFTAENGTVYSDEVLADPYNQYVTLGAGPVVPPPLSRAITDTHFAARDRMGRLVGFVARLMADGDLSEPVGIGVDEATAMVIDSGGAATVLGAGSVYLVVPAAPPASCAPGQPLSWNSVPVYELVAGDEAQFPAATTTVSSIDVSASGGALVPTDPY